MMCCGWLQTRWVLHRVGFLYQTRFYYYYYYIYIYIYIYIYCAQVLPVVLAACEPQTIANLMDIFPAPDERQKLQQVLTGKKS
jgi:hypothetical protein